MSDPQMNTRWDHVHQCGTCGHAMRIENIELKTIIAGVITCSRCEASGPINVKIMEEKLIPPTIHASHRNGQ